MKKYIFTLLLGAISFSLSAQRQLTREGYIRFFGATPAENIEGVSNQASSVIDASNGDIAWQVLLTSFTFEKALMQEHFNENYVESATFPKAEFRGSVEDFSAIDLSTNGEYEVTITGDLSLHGVTKPTSATGTLKVEDGAIILDVTFDAVPEDYDIEIPSLVRDKIASSFDVTVKAKYQPLE